MVKQTEQSEAHSAVLPQTESAVREALHAVRDPEIPVLSVVDLGMIGDIEVSEHSVVVKWMPTFVGCPALEHIQQQIGTCLRQLGFDHVQVVRDPSRTWSTDHITEEGRKKLEALGFGVPLPMPADDFVEAVHEARCPHCGSTQTHLHSFFGSTLCRSQHVCENCKSFFERFKPV